MSRIFGPVVQQGYVVPDMRKGIAHWLARGVGPFYLIEDIRTDEAPVFSTGLSISQNVSLLVLVGVIALWFYILRQPKTR